MVGGILLHCRGSWVPYSSYLFVAAHKIPSSISENCSRLCLFGSSDFGLFWHNLFLGSEKFVQQQFRNEELQILVLDNFIGSAGFGGYFAVFKRNLELVQKKIRSLYFWDYFDHLRIRVRLLLGINVTLFPQNTVR